MIDHGQRELSQDSNFDNEELLAQMPDFSMRPEHDTPDPLADYHKIESIFGRYSPEWEVYFPDSVPPVPERDPHTRAKIGQGTLELVYHRLGNIITNPLEDDVDAEDREIAWRLEIDHVVKNAPYLKDQVGDVTRINSVDFVEGMQQGLGTLAHTKQEEESIAHVSEYEALNNLWEFLAEAQDDTALDTRLRGLIQGIKNEISFIGEKELEDAARGLALYWKDRMDKNPRKPLVILPIDQDLSPNGFNGEGAMTKSSTYLLDKVLGYFSDADIQKYHKQLRFGFEGMGRSALKNARVIILDDWSLSGRQLKGARSRLIEQYPQLGLGGLEINLVAASQELIHIGLEGDGDGFHASLPHDAPRTPVRAYYMTRSPESFTHTSPGGFVTGAHSATDYALENVLGAVVNRHAEDEPPTILSTMPPLTNIVRPYRKEGYATHNIQRWRIGSGR